MSTNEEKSCHFFIIDLYFEEKVSSIVNEVIRTIYLFFIKIFYTQKSLQSSQATFTQIFSIRLKAQ